MIVEDKEKPTIEGVHNIETNVGSEVDLFEGVTISDNSHDTIKKEIIGSYDFKKTGIYNLTINHLTLLT